MESTSKLKVFFSTFIVLALAQIVLIKVEAQDAEGIYYVGTGIADVTGPAAGVVLNGYVNPLTLAAGIHTRLHARSFIVQSITTNNSIVFVSCDLGMFDHAIKLEAVKKLKLKFGEKYTEKNVQISATHTHSGPSGYMQYYAYLVIESYGFNPLSFWAIVDGVVESIEKADASLTRGRVFRNKGELLGYNGNRQEGAYMQNPQAERDLYNHTVDKEMRILRFESVDDAGTSEPIGCFSWWPVHPISFNNWDNPLISSDNRGYASVMFDYQMNSGSSARPGKGKFVAAFAAANLGDVSPRTPGRKNVTDELENVQIVGQGQFLKAFELFNDQETLELVKGPIDYVQQYVDMTNMTVEVENTTTGEVEMKKTCKAAMGYAFVGLDPAQQEFWDKILHLIKKPSDEMVECHKPKIVAIPAGEMNNPWEWAPSIVDLNILRLGSVDIVSVPGEFTTMSGRRVRKAMEKLAPAGQEIIVGGLANNYINYIATPEEYDFQEYEAGATIFGKYTLNAIIQKQEEFMTALNAENASALDPGTPPPNFTDRLRDKIVDRVDELPGNRTHWGEIVYQPRDWISVGEELLVVFITPSLRHDSLRGSSHFTIEREINNGNDQFEWGVIRTDADLDTTFWWNSVRRWGEAKWLKIPEDTIVGKYRVGHTGYYLENVSQPLQSYRVFTLPFDIINPSAVTMTPPSSSCLSTPSINLILFMVFGKIFSLF